MASPPTSSTSPALSVVPELPSPLAVVCHDAGACNVILPWLTQPGLRVRAVMQGPALRLWKARFGERPLCANIEVALDGAAMLLSGTGWATSLEHDARVMAARAGMRSAAVIDHWVNYTERFTRGAQTLWPGEIWVTDADALRMAQRSFPGADVRCLDNLYLAEQVAQVGPLRSGDVGVLYVMEPMRNDWGLGAPGEWQALEYFVQHRQALGIAPDAPMRLRPHPSDPKGKYDGWLGGPLGQGVALDRSPSLAAAMSGCAWVAGCESYALVVGLAAGRRVVSTLPPWAPACRLPQAGLLHLRDLAAGVVG
jgi:hypothetical protein